VGERWTWDAAAHPGVASALAGPDWCDRLEGAASDALVGKVLCVCAALGVARHVLGEPVADPQTAGALDLLDCWIDDPTEERFERIRGTIFGPDEPAEIGPHGVGWWALRTATSSVGNSEAGWALGTVCSAAEAAGFTPEAARVVGERAVLARRQDAEPLYGSSDLNKNDESSHLD
jgi:hypothetical protein